MRGVNQLLANDALGQVNRTSKTFFFSLSPSFFSKSLDQICTSFAYLLPLGRPTNNRERDVDTTLPRVRFQVQFLFCLCLHVSSSESNRRMAVRLSAILFDRCEPISQLFPVAFPILLLFFLNLNGTLTSRLELKFPQK